MLVAAVTVVRYSVIDNYQWRRNEFESGGAQVRREAPENFFYNAPSLFKGARLSGGSQCMFGRAHFHCFVLKTGLQIKPL